MRGVWAAGAPRDYVAIMEVVININVLPSLTAKLGRTEPASRLILKFRVSFTDQAKKFLSPLGFHQIIPKRLTHEHPGDLGQGLEMQTG